MPVDAILRTLARLSAAEQPQRLQLDISKAAGLVWLGDGDNAFDALTVTARDPDAGPTLDWHAPAAARRQTQRLAAYDALHREDRLLRLGWAFLCGPATVGGQRRRLCLPLVSRPVRLSGGGRTFGIRVAGDLALLPLVTDWNLAADLEAGLGGRPDWIEAALAAAGFADVPVLGPDHDPTRLVKGDELVVVKGCGLHAGEAAVSTQQGVALREWAAHPDTGASALAWLYAEHDPPPPPDGPVVSALPLSPSQQDAVRAARRAPITVLGGPPGSGKTHTLAAIALDAVGSGSSVLLASRTPNAADVLAGALRAAGGPAPVLFGDSELRHTLARELSDGLPAGAERPRPDAHALDRAVAELARIEEVGAAALRDEDLAAAAQHRQPLMAAFRATAPAAFHADADLVRLRALLEPRTGFLGAWRTRMALRRARRLAGAPANVGAGDLDAALRAAEQSAAQVRLAAAGGTTFDQIRELLAGADAAVGAAAATWVGELAAARRHSGRARRAVAALATALRSGRAARRRALAAIRTKDLTAALPLWVGTLADVEDILPADPGMFDLVIVDEASHVDQPLAAAALLRGQRAVISGDPRQLRHVSFVSDDAVHAATVAEGTEELVDRLDVRRVSLLDTAAAGVGVHWLTEHHRCAPHLIGFAATRFYEDRIALLTTHPSIADLDCIDVEQVVGERTESGVNPAEVDAVLAHLRERIAAGVASIGVVSPFRAQADALEKALLERMDVDRIVSSGLRVGTVHGVQGSEFDEVVISLVLSDADPGSAWRFVNDRSLLAVLTTRARRRVHVITSSTEPVGLAAEYLRHAAEPPRETEGVEPADEWTARLADELAAAGVRVRTGYPVGHWRVDLVVGERADAVAVETHPHPDGPAAHLARWRALRGAGWDVRDAYPSRYDDNPTTAAQALRRP